MSMSIRTAAMYSLFQRYVSFLINFANSIVLARLLTPRETGIYSLSLAIVFVANTLRDFGLGEYIVQAKDLTREKLRASYTASLILAWSISLAMVVFAAPIAAYFQEEGVRQVLKVLALNFLLLPIGTTAFALLTKELAFRSIFWVQTLSSLAGTLLGIFLAFRGHSYMSLAWATVTSAAVTSLILILIRPAESLLLPSLQGIKPVIRFGGPLTIGRIAEQIGNRLPDLIIGRFLGFSAVGLNSKAGSLTSAFFDFFITAVLRVATPTLAKNEDDRQFGATFRNLLTLTSLPQLLFFGFLLLYAHPLILFLFGAKWLSCVPLIQIGALSGMLWTPYMLSSSALTARGEAMKQMQIQIISLPFGVAMVMIGAQYSLIAVSALGLVTILQRLILLERAMRATLGIRIASLLPALRPSILAALWGAGFSAIPLALSGAQTSHPLILLVAGSLCLMLGATLGCLMTRHPIVPEVVQMLAQIRSQGRRA